MQTASGEGCKIAQLGDPSPRNPLPVQPSICICLMTNTPSKERWKALTKMAINNYWQNQLKEEAAEKDTLKYLNTEACKVGKVHPVWRCGTDPMQATMAATKTRLLVQRYALTGTHCAGKNRRDHCPLCDGPPETLAHFMLECIHLHEDRTPHLTKIKKELESLKYKTTDQEELLQILLDPSKANPPDNKLEEWAFLLRFSGRYSKTMRI